jgi:hypothetical protein
LARGAVPVAGFSARIRCVARFPRRARDAEYVRILYIAATSGEAVVERALLDLLESAARFDADGVRHAVRPERPSVPIIMIAAPDLRVYDALLGEAVS